MDEYCNHACCNGTHCCDVNWAWGRMALSFLMLVCGVTMNYTGIGWFANPVVNVAWFVVAFLPVGLTVIGEAYENIKQKDVFSEFFLMSVASIGAFVIGEYPEAVAVMLFYTLGETLQHRAVERATGDVSRLLDVRPERTGLLRNGKYVQVHPNEVVVGEIIEVRPGERVPLDGILLDNDAMLDTSALTGESVPRSAVQGDEVLAGMFAGGSTLHLRVNRPYDESALSRILHIVKDASSRKAPAELFIRRFARVYTPIVILLAILITIVPAAFKFFVPTFDYTFSDWLYRGLVFLVISCPCALVISVPLAYFAGIGKASRCGILFKGGNFLYAMAKTDCVIFDKTGTLTSGKFKVVDVQCNNIDKVGFLTMVASAECQSTHPIAKAIVAYAEECGIKIVAPSQLREVAGLGIEAIIDGKKVIAGNYAMMSENGISVSNPINGEGMTVVACAMDGIYIGAVMLADQLKKDSKKAVERLKQLDVTDLYMLSGDKQEVVNAIGRQLGLANAIGGLLPEEKVQYVEKIAQSGRQVAFVGDGMNDAPALVLSNVGVAMGGLGSDAAIESADVVIQTDNPLRVATAIQIGRATSRIVMQNIVGAIGVKVVVMLAGALGFASLWWAVFADVGVALLAVLNSLRILGKKFQ